MAVRVREARVVDLVLGHDRRERLPRARRERRRERGVRGVEVLTRSDGEVLALFVDRWRLGTVVKENPDLLLEPLVGARV